MPANLDQIAAEFEKESGAVGDLWRRGRGAAGGLWNALRGELPDLSEHAHLVHPATPPPIPTAALKPPAAPVKTVVDSTKDALKGVPSWLLGGTLGAATGTLVDSDDRVRGALNGAGIGALGGYMWDKLPGAPAGHTVTAAEKQGFFTPSISTGGSLGLSYSGGSERLPGTSSYAGRDVIERAGKALDEGKPYEDVVAAGAKSPKVTYLPMAAAVLGGLVGRTLKNTPTGWLGGGAAGLAAGYLGKSRMQQGIDAESQSATKGLLIERANMGDQHARNVILQHHQDLFPGSRP
jgi:hypothetical protein